MKKIALVLALSFFSLFANAENADNQMIGNNVHADSLLWVCHLGFKGTAMGFKVIFGRFETNAYGTLKCKGIGGGYYTQDVKISMGHKWFGPTVGLGYYKLAGLAKEISLFNLSPESILGHYKVAQADAVVIGGVGSFTAVKLGLPQLAFNVSLKLLFGFGADVGIDKLCIEPVNSEETPEPTPSLE
ncbi:MAG: hypothetical protein ACXVCY_08945 [Pseudobdellovibrionaceae bacterium]